MNTSEPKKQPKPKEPELPKPTLDARNFIQSDYEYIPSKRDVIKKLKFPWVVALTPIPANPVNIPQATVDYDHIIRCPTCNAVLSNKTIMLDSRVEYLCNICGKKQIIRLQKDEYYTNPQFSEAVLGMDCIEPYSPTIVKILIIENSELTQQSGLFTETFLKVRTELTNITKGYYSVMMIANGLYFPHLFDNRTKFKRSQVCEIDNMAFPLIKSICFDMSNNQEKELLFKYLDFLQEIKPASTFSTVLSLLNSLASSYSEQPECVHITMFTSALTPGSGFENGDKIGSKLLRSNIGFDLFYLHPTNTPCRGVLDALAAFSMLNNSHLTEFTPEQAHVMSDDIARAFFTPRYFNLSIEIRLNPTMLVKDIKGCGLRKNDFTFTVASFRPGDTVLFFLEHANEAIDIPSPGIQFEWKFIDPNGKRKAVSANLRYTLCDNYYEVVKRLNGAPLISGFAALAIDSGRESRDENSMLICIEKILKDCLYDSFIRLFLKSSKNVENITYAVSNMDILLNFTRAAEIFGCSPQDNELYFCPMARQLSPIEVFEEGPINGKNIMKGALLIRTSFGKTMVYISTTEDISAWMQFLSRPPLSEVVIEASKGAVTEIVNPSSSAKSRMYVRLIKCAKNQIRN